MNSSPLPADRLLLKIRINIPPPFRCPNFTSVSKISKVKDGCHLLWKKGDGGEKSQSKAEVRVAMKMTSENLLFQRNFLRNLFLPVKKYKKQILGKEFYDLPGFLSREKPVLAYPFSHGWPMASFLVAWGFGRYAPEASAGMGKDSENEMKIRRRAREASAPAPSPEKSSPCDSKRTVRTPRPGARFALPPGLKPLKPATRDGRVTFSPRRAQSTPRKAPGRKKRAVEKLPPPPFNPRRIKLKIR
jgi:hypothetical protein